MFSRISIKRPITTIMITLMVLLGGSVGLSALKLDLMPAMDIPVAVVSTTYVGAGPSEIENLITEPLEGALGTVSNVKTISSTSSANSSMIIVQFEDGTDIDMASIDMREKIDLIKGSLPEDANDPTVIKMDMEMMSSIMVGVSSNKYDLIELNSLVDENIVNRIERIEGVASVSLVGGIENEIEIKVKPEKMQGYGVTESSLAQVLSAENLNYPTGSIEQGTTSMQIRTVGEFKSVEEIRNLPIKTSTGAVVHVSDFAEVNEVEKDMSSFALINGEPGIMLM
ncbi:MAG TPA: efflux RND transporter permease subunit, partial [Candidatus Fimicola cottocaccae]|nr:efflux RND transporter permease subunit [Candidatus Fimicola cottocaccae]